MERQNKLGVMPIGRLLAVMSIPMMISFFIQALGRSRYTLIVNLCRQLIFMVPTAWLLSLSGRLEPVWLAVVIAEVMSAALSLLLRRKLLRDLAREVPV